MDESTKGRADGRWQSRRPIADRYVAASSAESVSVKVPERCPDLSVPDLVPGVPMPFERGLLITLSLIARSPEKIARENAKSRDEFSELRPGYGGKNLGWQK